MRIVAALGGNAIAPRGGSLSPTEQLDHVGQAADALAALVRAGHELVVTHGNGPQVGLLAAQSPDLSLDALGAESDGVLGYWIDRELANRLPDREVAALLTQVEVDADDVAFAEPTKPIGQTLSAAERDARAAIHREAHYAAEGAGFRRVVPSPEPRSIVELNTITLLVREHVIVVCGGGGGIPVVRDELGHLRGCEAVIDKDRFSALLAEELDADFLLLLTDVPGVYEDWPEPAERLIRSATPEELEALLLDRGSMGPKVESACRFVRRTNRAAAIGALDRALDLVNGVAGTRVHSSAKRRP